MNPYNVHEAVIISMYSNTAFNVIVNECQCIKNDTNSYDKFS